MRVTAQFSDPAAPYRDIAVRRVRTTEEDAPVLAPTDWPLSVAQAVAAMDRPDEPVAPAIGPGRLELPACLTGRRRRGSGVASVLRVLDRLAARWTGWGWRLGLFDQDADAQAFYDDVRWLLVRRRIAPDATAWRGIAIATPHAGFAVDPFQGVLAPARDLPGFATAERPEAPGDTVEAVVAMMRGAVAARAGAAGTMPAPAIALDLIAFLDRDGVLDVPALAAAVRIAVIVGEIELSTRVVHSEAAARAVYARRPLALSPANLAGFVLAQGLGYDSDAGRALAQAVGGLVTACAEAASAEMAAEHGPCPAAQLPGPAAAGAGQLRDATRTAIAQLSKVARPSHLSELARGIGRIAMAAWAQVAADGRQGLRHGRLTTLSDAATRAPMPPALRTLGARPLPAHPVDQELANGSIVRLVVPELATGLTRLGYGVEVQAAAIRHLRGRRTLAGAPGVSLAGLRDKGLGNESVARVEAALAEATELGQALNPWVIGIQACEDELGFAVGADHYGFDLASALGFTAEAVAAANRHCFGAGTLAGTPGLAAADAEALACPADETALAAAEGRMIAALNAVLSAPAPEAAERAVERALPDPDLEQEDIPVVPTHALAAVGRS